jgi:HEAT repeat protein
MMRCRYALMVAVTLLGWPTQAGMASAQEASARDILARFNGDDPGWRVRVESLVGVAKIGPAALPALVDALGAGSPRTREFAAQALAMFNDARARPALEKAAHDPKSTVRIYAILALRMLGALEPAEKWEKLRTDPDRGVRSTVAGALDCKDAPNPAALRQAWATYDLTRLGSAQVGRLAPEFTLAAHSGPSVQLADFRGKKDVVLRYFRFDY